ncbi:MAG: serine hydrolase, partial [Clostridia bacterium]|nr:serine hydrolase [Clostridia bacterium]
MLSCAGGYPWGDSGLICRTEDICRFARLLANGGAWNGKQLLEKETVSMAIECHTDTSVETHPYSQSGYGYQIWKNPTGGFSFLGMHGQYMHYDPKTDIIFACTSGNKSGNSGQIIFDGLEKFIFGAKSEPLPENSEEYMQLKTMIANLSLLSLHGAERSEIETAINENKYFLSENPMGIEWIMFNFSDTVVRIEYQNEQGIKHIICGRNRNCLQRFPQTGYSRAVGGSDSPGNTYECVASATWQADNILIAKIQIVDEYIGILDMKFEFEKKHLAITMEKNAENFLKEYDGKAIANMR